MSRGAKTAVEVCARVTKGEDGLVIADSKMLRIAEAIATAMRESDVFFSVVSKSITHTKAVRDAAQAGSRGIMLTQFTEGMLVSGGMEADFAALAPACRSVALALQGAHLIHLFTPAGTDLTMSASGRPGNALTCIVGPGQFSPIPNVEANVSPVEGSAQGVIVVDGSVPYAGIGVIREPIRVTVQNGNITGITGGQQARMLRDAYAEKDDPLVYNVAELGIGLNPKCHFCGIMLEDEGVYGTVHIGTGTNITLGGHVKAACHYDLIMVEPTVVADGRVVLDRGRVC